MLTNRKVGYVTRLY